MNRMTYQIIQFILGALVLAAAIVLRDNSAAPYIFLVSYAILGWRVIYKAVRNILRGEIFDENLLMSIATGGAFIIGEYSEAVAVMLFYLVGEFFQDFAVDRSEKSITELMNIRPDYANVMTGGEIKRVAPESVKPGDVIVVKPGERIPLDGIITDGQSMLDTAALTGESMPRSVGPSNTVYSGCINQSGVLTVEVKKEFGESTAAKIIDLAQNAVAKKAPTENFITTFARYYTPVVVGMAALLALIPPLCFGGQWSDWIHRALVFLVISCPCALVISIPLSFFAGIGGAARGGVLVKGGNYLEALAKLDTVVFDKTGTLTKGAFEVAAILPADRFSQEELLGYAARAEAFSSHPIAVSIMRAYGKDIDESELKDYAEAAGYGVSVTICETPVLVGNSDFMKSKNIGIIESGNNGTKVYVAADGKYAGCIVISDEVKPDSKPAVAGLRELGVAKIVMLSGDSKEIAEPVARELSLDEVYAELLPQQKVEMVEKLSVGKRTNGKLAFVGDGINDAPVLAAADIGIAMGALGSDAAIEASDVVLMTDEPSKLINAVKTARKTGRIVTENIVFALGVKLVFMLLGALGISGMWEAVFADIGVSLLAVLNALRAMRVRHIQNAS